MDAVPAGPHDVGGGGRPALRQRRVKHRSPMQTTFGPQPPWEAGPSPALPGGVVPSEPPVNRLALAAFACSLLGVALLPMIGGLVGAGLGAAALARMRPGESGR